MNLKVRLAVMNFLEFAVWGAYLTSMGNYLGKAGMGAEISWFYTIQGIVSIFMPTLMGIVADKYIQPQRLLGYCHLLAGAAMIGLFGMGQASQTPNEAMFIAVYTFSVAFYMPTIALSNSVAYTALRQGGFNTVSAFPPIRVFGTVGFICAMLTSNFTGFQNTYMQWYFSGILGVILGLYCFPLPACPTCTEKAKSLAEALGLKAFALFKEKKMAIFFIFSMLLGMSLQITNAYANPFINGFNSLAGFAGSWGANNANALISLSQMSETLCILLIPFFLKRFGIKKVMLISMFAWVLRFGFFGLGNPSTAGGIVLLVASMIVYGVAFDFFNVSGSLYVDKETDPAIRSSAQGVFMLMTNGFGAMIGTLGAQWVINKLVNVHINAYTAANGFLPSGAVYPADVSHTIMTGWSESWFIFSGFSLVVAILFACIFKYKHVPEA